MTSALRLLPILAGLGLATASAATPLEPSLGGPGPAELTLRPSQAAPEWLSTSAIGPDEGPHAGILEPAPPPPDAAPNASGSGDVPGSPGVDPALVRKEIELAQRQARRGDLEGAVASLKRAIRLDPDQPEARAGIGITLTQLGRADEAEGHLLRAIELGGGTAPVHASLAEVAKAQGRLRDSVQHGRDALRLDPGLVPAANNLAWLLATSRDPALLEPAEAIRLAEGALRGGGEHPALLDTLAAAYAASGRYDEAIRTASRAERLARERGLADIARDIRTHLDLYRAGKPFVES